jgi:hypothetical protein
MSTQSIEEIVQRLARWHFEIEEGIERIIWFKNGEDKAIHLLEVNRDTFPEDKVLVFYHRPTTEYPIPVRLADVTPDEWEKVKKGLIPLPDGWSLDDIKIFERKDVLQAVESKT